MRKITVRSVTLLVAILTSLTFLLPIFASAAATGNKEDSSENYLSLDYYNNSKIGIMTGTIFDDMAKKTFDNPQILYFNTNSDMIEALNSNRIDAFIADEPVFRSIKSQNNDLIALDDYLSDDNYGFFFSKNEESKKLCDELSTYITELKKAGTLDELVNKWYSDNAEVSIKPESLTDINGTLIYAVDSQYPPFAFVKDGKITGYDIDILTSFCEKYGYAIKFEETKSDAVISCVVSGKATLSGGGISITEERKESVYFTEPYYSGGSVLVIKNPETSVIAEFNSIAELNGKKFAVKTGSVFDKIVSDCKQLSGNETIEYYKTEPDEMTALLNGKVDAVIADEPVGIMMTSKNPSTTVLKEHFSDDSYGFGFKKGSELTEPFNKALEKLKKSGKLEELNSKWLGSDNTKKVLIEQNWEGKNGTLKYRTDQTVEPMCYMGENGKIIGLEIDIVLHIAEIMDYKVEITGSDFSSLIPDVTTGKADIISACMSITEERRQSIDFSEPYYNGAVVAVVRTENSSENETGFIQNIKESFNKTFIRESRWKLFTEGIGTTLIITVLSIIFGTILGFGVFMLCKGGNVFANKITVVFVAILQKTPIVVLLMILYYIVFSKSSINGMWVSVTAFTLTFGAAVLGMLRMGVGAVDKGQTEASLALGYTENRTFFKIILPQASAHFMPSFKSEIISLLKSTSIVGYIAVEDLTKMSDLVRSRTYEAFFPLIITAIIYFILAQILTSVVQLIINRTDPKRRTPEKILKGVNVK